MSKKWISIIVLSMLLAGVLTGTALAATRKGTSSGEKIAFMWGFHYKGAHKSSSSMVEDVISVQGELTVSGSLVDACDAGHSGTVAACTTVQDLLWPFYPATAASDHFFHKAGFKDSSFKTSKNF